jgi:hypothetical protein
VTVPLLLSVEYFALGVRWWLYDYGAGLDVVSAFLGLARTGSSFTLWSSFLAGGQDRLAFWGSGDPFNVWSLLSALLPAWQANGLLAPAEGSVWQVAAPLSAVQGVRRIGPAHEHPDPAPEPLPASAAHRQ